MDGRGVGEEGRRDQSEKGDVTTAENQAFFSVYYVRKNVIGDR